MPILDLFLATAHIFVSTGIKCCRNRMCHIWQLPHAMMCTDTHTCTHKTLPIQTSRLFFWGFAWTLCTVWTVGLLKHTWNPSSLCWRAGGSQENNSPFILTPSPMAGVQPCQACPTLWGAGQPLRMVAQKRRWEQETKVRREWIQPSRNIKSLVCHSLMLRHSLELAIHLLSVSALLLLFWRH